MVWTIAEEDALFVYWAMHMTLYRQSQNTRFVFYEMLHAEMPAKSVTQLKSKCNYIESRYAKARTLNARAALRSFALYDQAATLFGDAEQ